MHQKWTWQSSNGVTRNIIDFILVGRRWRNSITMCRAFPSTDIGSDHQLVMAGVKLKLSKRNNQGRRKKFNIERKTSKKATRKLFKKSLS